MTWIAAKARKVIETFETIKLFLNIPECTFVIGADPDKIQEAIADTYRVRDPDQSTYTHDYLEKIVQLPFRIPEQQEADIACYVALLAVQRCIAPDGWRELIAERVRLRAEGSFRDALIDWIRRHEVLFPSGADFPINELSLTTSDTHLMARALRGNPRQIKRFLNIYELRRRLATANGLNIQHDVLIKVLALEYVWRDFFKNLTDTVDLGVGSF